jgi:hypothetical protein
MPEGGEGALIRAGARAYLREEGGRGRALSYTYFCQIRIKFDVLIKGCARAYPPPPPLRTWKIVKFKKKLKHLSAQKKGAFLSTD